MMNITFVWVRILPICGIEDLFQGTGKDEILDLGSMLLFLYLLSTYFITHLVQSSGNKNRQTLCPHAVYSLNKKAHGPGGQTVLGSEISVVTNWSCALRHGLFN